MFSIGCCCGPPLGDDCQWCNTDTTPLQGQLTFENIENDSCTECGDYNTTTFLLTQVPGPFNNDCYWEVGQPLPCDGESTAACKLQVIRTNDVGGAYLLNVWHEITTVCTVGQASGIRDLVAQPSDCIDDTPVGGDMVNGSGVWCKWDTGASVGTWEWNWVV